MQVAARARRGAVLGHPIGHSKSPALHRAAARALDTGYDYQAIDLQVPELAAFLERVRTEGDWYGLSVTMPLKNAAAELADELTPTAAALGAANTLVVTAGPDGGTHLLGENTDVAGIVNALRHAGVPGRPRAAVLGAGGTAVSAVAALARLRAPAVDVFARTPAKAGAVERVAATLGMPVRVLAFDRAAAALGQADVVISTLPPHAADPLAAQLAALPGSVPQGACLLDVAYDPWPSALATAWQGRGGAVVPGIEMLLYQGVEQAKLFAAAGGFAERAAGRTGDILNVMCDALGLPRRTPDE